MTTVPNQFPTILNQPYRIAIIGEAPGADEIEQGKPFVGHSGRLLNEMLAGAGILRDACFVGNVCQHRLPSGPGGKPIINYSSPEIAAGIERLADDLGRLWQPNLVVCLGGTALWWAKGQKESIDSWRGSLFQSRHGWKCLPSIHPAAVLREYSFKPLLRFDLKRAATEGRFPDLRTPVRSLLSNLTPVDSIALLDTIPDGTIISPDIEGYWNNLKMCSIATSATNGFIVNFQSNGDIPTEMALWRSFARVMGNPKIGKIFQNALYELFVLEYGYRIPIRGLVDDTMLKHWELFCELPKSLDFQASIYTLQPFWKDEKMYDSNRASLMEGCCMDSAVTYEINNILTPQLKGPQLSHYQLNLSLLRPLVEMEKTGMNYDKEKAEKKLSEVVHNENRMQWALNNFAKKDSTLSHERWFEICRDTFCFVKELGQVATLQDIIPHCKTTCLHLATEAVKILSNTSLSIADQGRLSVLTETCLNVDSKTQLPDFLYRELNLPIQYKKEKGRLTTKETTDQLALLTLYKKTSDPVLKLILTIRALRTRSETLSARTDADGRIRCGYNIVGTETGRLSCYESPTGSGFNLQTVTKKDRNLFLPDEGYWMFQCDLSGADGWTVAAWCKACGDPTMMDDYLFGLKPARNNVLLYRHGRQVLSWSREKLKEEAKTVDPDGWEYFACKKVQHGVSYGMGADTISNNILKDSYKLWGEPIRVEPTVCEELKRFFLTRYFGILLWHERIKRQLKTNGYIVSASGHKRMFFGRLDDHKTFRDACADEPQENTTYAIKLALYRIWTDPANHRSQDRNNQTLPEGVGSVPHPSGVRSDAQPGIQCNETTPTKGQYPSFGVDLVPINRLKVQPLHTVHDSINGQFRKEETTWAIGKIREWFNNPITIAGQQIVIPFEGAYGESWGRLKEGTI